MVQLAVAWLAGKVQVKNTIKVKAKHASAAREKAVMAGRLSARDAVLALLAREPKRES